MNNFLKSIEKKLKNSISVEKITITDNRHKHKKHKFFDVNKYHLHIEISSSYLSTLTRLNSQRTVMKVLEDELKNQIHALEIKII